MKTITPTLAAILLSTSAFAADLPSSKTPVFTQVQTVDTTGFYAGVRGGYAVNGKVAVGGANVGYDFGVLRTEANYDYINGSTFTGNAILQHRFGNVTPYALAGLGYSFGDTLDWNRRTPIWNVGGGLRYDLGRNFEVDGRYRFIRAFDGYKGQDHVVTAGVNYRF